MHLSGKIKTLISIADARNPTKKHYLRTAVVVITMRIAENECYRSQQIFMIDMTQYWDWMIIMIEEN